MSQSIRGSVMLYYIRHERLRLRAPEKNPLLIDGHVLPHSDDIVISVFELASHMRVHMVAVE